MIRTRMVFYTLSLITTTLFAACSGTQKSSGYYKTSQLISADSVNKLKSVMRQISNDPFTAYQYPAADKFMLNYRLLSPSSISSQEKYPLVLVLHSSGTPIGTDNTSQLGILVKLWAQPSVRQKYPAYIVAPQFPARTSNYAMDSNRHVLASVPDPHLTAALQLVDSLKKALPVDPHKIYVMGFSMGGSSTINSLELRPDLFAAAVSISGIPSFNKMEELSKIPIWLIHGNADTENPFASDSVFYKEMKSRNNKRTRFWEINNLEHDVFYKLYTTELIPEWLFRIQKQ